MLTQLERIDDRGIVEEILSPHSLVANRAASTPLREGSVAAVSAWRSPSFYIGVVLMALILAATLLVRLAMALRGVGRGRLSA